MLSSPSFLPVPVLVVLTAENTPPQQHLNANLFLSDCRWCGEQPKTKQHENKNQLLLVFH